MAQFVNSSFCRNRCFDRGLCYVLENGYHCLCYQPSAYDDCRDDNFTTPGTTTTIIQKEPSTVLSVKIVCGFVAVVLLSLALITLYGWHQLNGTRRNSTGVDQARREAARITFHASAPPLEEQAV